MQLSSTARIAGCLLAAGLWAGVPAATSEDVIPAQANASQREAMPRTIEWRSDYARALDAAQQERKFALLWFFEPEQADAMAALEQGPLAAPGIAEVLEERYVAVRLPVGARRDGSDETLLAHPAFGELGGQAGLAIVDLTDEASPHFRRVVSVYPFRRGPITAERLAVLLTLPKGSLTQRTLIYAVRTHPETPQSAQGHFSYVLAEETAKHSGHQASIRLQGHHQWESRFHAINAQLPGGLVAREVCAESWPGQDLLDAAEECVASWRQSAGHWAAVSQRHTLFGYDMQRGANGVWYATGIFASRP
jgi:hypothetical protein